jgi:hypothetical protein
MFPLQALFDGDHPRRGRNYSPDSRGREGIDAETGFRAAKTGAGCGCPQELPETEDECHKCQGQGPFYRRMK